MRLIIDTSILISRPEILSQGGDSIQFVLPEVVYEQLSSSRFGDRARDLLERAARADRLEIILKPEKTLPTEFRLSKRLDYIDTLILFTAVDYQRRHPSQDVYLV